MSELLTDEITDGLDQLIEPVMAGEPIENWAEASTAFLDAVIEIAAELGEERHERLLPPIARECADRAQSATDIWMLRAVAVRNIYEVSLIIHEATVAAQATRN